MSIDDSMRFLPLMLVVTFIAQVGCHSNHAEHQVTAEDVVAEIDRLRRVVRPMPPGATDAAWRALNSRDPAMRAEAAMSLAKSKRLSRAITEQLEVLALHDVDPVVRAAALSALFEGGTPSPRLMELVENLRNNSQLSLFASQLSTEK